MTSVHKDVKIEESDSWNRLEDTYTRSSIDESGVKLNQTNLICRYLNLDLINVQEREIAGANLTKFTTMASQKSAVLCVGYKSDRVIKKVLTTLHKEWAS